MIHRAAELPGIIQKLGIGLHAYGFNKALVLMCSSAKVEWDAIT